MKRYIQPCISVNWEERSSTMIPLVECPTGDYVLFSEAEARIKVLEAEMEQAGQDFEKELVIRTHLEQQIAEMQDMIAHLIAFVPDLVEREKLLDWLKERRPE